MQRQAEKAVRTRLNITKKINFEALDHHVLRFTVSIDALLRVYHFSRRSWKVKRVQEDDSPQILIPSG